MTENGQVSSARIRIDKWLWFARQTKTRSLAQKLVADGGIRLNSEKTTSPSRNVGPGDVLTVKIGEQVRVLKIIDCGSRRGPFSEAQLLYEDLSPPTMPHEKLTKGEQGLPEPHGKPDGRERMLARRLSGKE